MVCSLGDFHESPMVVENCQGVTKACSRKTQGITKFRRNGPRRAKNEPHATTRVFNVVLGQLRPRSGSRLRDGRGSGTFASTHVFPRPAISGAQSGPSVYLSSTDVDA